MVMEWKQLKTAKRIKTHINLWYVCESDGWIMLVNFLIYWTYDKIDTNYESYSEGRKNYGIVVVGYAIVV